VITALNNYAMPFIRYRTGDVGREAVEPCPCGRGLPTLQSVSGRIFEVLINARGDRIDPHFFSHLFHSENLGGLRRFQVIQEDYARLTIKLSLEPGAAWSQNGQNGLTEKIQRVMGPECEVAYHVVDDIPLAASGKHQYIIRNVGNDLERRDPRG
jgi:phenylacetate-CoA ligase